MAETLLIIKNSAPVTANVVGTLDTSRSASPGLHSGMVAVGVPSPTATVLSVGGVTAQVDPITWDNLGNVATAKVTAPVAAGPLHEIVQGAGSTPGATIPTIATLGLQLMEVQMVTAQGAILRAQPFTTNDAEIIHSTGPYIDERTYRFRLVNAAGTAGVDRDGPGCAMVVRRRSDMADGIEIELLVCANVFDPGANPYQTQAINPGDIHYQDISISGSGVMTMHAIAPSSMSTAAKQLVANVGGSVHKLHNGNFLVRRFILAGPSLSAGSANAILGREDHGVVRGLWSYYKQPAHGPQRMPLPEWPATFTHGGQTGYDAAILLGQEFLNGVQGAVTSGGTFSSGTFEQAAQGAWHPFGYANPFTPSGVGVQLQSGFLNTREEWRAGIHELDHLMQREAGIYDSVNGEWLSWDTCNALAGTFTPASGGPITKAAGQNIFNGGPHERNDFQWPHHLLPADAPGNPANFVLAPTARAWNGNGGLTSLSTQQTMRTINAPNYGRHDGAHLIRFTRAARIAIWGCGDRMSIECMRARFSWLSTQLQNGDEAPEAVASFNRFSAGLYNFQHGLTKMLPNNHGEGTGTQSDGVGNMGGYGAFDRRMGHFLDQIGTFAAACPASERARHAGYFLNASLHVLRAASPNGMFGRQDDHRTALNGGQHPFIEDPANYGPTNLGAESGSLNGSVASPTQQSQFGYYFHHAFILNGMVSMARSAAAQTQADALAAVVETHVNEVFTARPGTQGAPNYYTTMSKTQGLPITGAPAPATSLLAWDYTSGGYNTIGREWAPVALAHLMVLSPRNVTAWRTYAVQTMSNNNGSSFTSYAALEAQVISEIQSNSSGKANHATLTLGYLSSLAAMTQILQ